MLKEVGTIILSLFIILLIHVCIDKLFLMTNTGRVCTTRDVAACSSVAQQCETFKPPTDKMFNKMFPKAYANVCQEPSTGELCLYTDIEYNTCDEAKISGLIAILAK